ncbi:MAG: ABC transporter ATP-binding protein [Anaerolineae bacterium]|nr:ABC transporter ATP-binding protein [Anaerolineae bacterium]
MPFLVVDNVYKEYENTPLLQGVSFAVEQGEITCLLGASGSGKTTLLRIVAGLETPERGRITLEGQDIGPTPTHRRGIVLMFQDYALFPHKTVGENIAFGLKFAPIKESAIQNPKSKIQNRVQEMLTLVGLEGFANRDVNTLSGGERQRVALARSLAPQPRLLLLDEPLGALDRNLRERLLEELPAILRRVGVTAITVTHDQEEAFALADRVILLDAGQVVQNGTPDVVYDNPASAWAARFLGLDNLFPATVTATKQIQTPFGVLDFAGNAALPQPGATGTVLIHPWGITLNAPPDHATNDGATARLPFSATVTGRTFHGPIYRLTLSLSGGALQVTCSPDRAPGEKDTVAVQIDPRALRWLG